jgi:vacuolar-type H+-ATPase subunit H
MNLKSKFIILVPLVTLAVALGCGKKEESPAETLKKAAEQPATEVVKPATATATATATAVVSEAQGLIDKAKALISNKDYQGAAALLSKVSAMQLTPEQKALVNDLQAQVQKFLTQQATDKATSEATKALDGMLKK